MYKWHISRYTNINYTKLLASTLVQKINIYTINNSLINSYMYGYGYICICHDEKYR